MYEKLTAYLDILPVSEYGKWIIDRENDGSPEHPIQMPFVNYHAAITWLMDETMQFVDDHEDMHLTRYSDILGQSGIEWGIESMSRADVSELDGGTVAALLVGAVRGERFCDGAFLAFCENGSIRRWLLRLKEIDQGG